MANSDKNIRIQPNRNSTLFPKITFTGQSNNPITLNVLDDNSISFEGSAGQLFSINNNLSSGYIFSVNDISGLPSFRINADGTVGIAEFYGNVGIGITNPSYKFHARGDSYFSSTGNTALLLLSGTGGTIIASNSVNITLTDPARKGLVINAATSQSANLLEWYADGGAGSGYALAGRIRPSGHVNLGNTGTITMSDGTSALLSLQGRGSSEGLAIRGFNSGASVPLFEIQGNPGNQYFGIYGDGGVNAPRINVTNGTASTSTTNGALIVTGGVGIGGSVNIGSALTVSGTTKLNSSLFNIPPTSSIGASLLQSGYGPFGSFWTGYQVENGYLIYGRQVSGGPIVITEPLTGAQVGGTSNIFAEALQHFKWGKDKYVVLASTGNSVLYSTSPVGAGSSWAFATLPTTASWQRLEYGNNRFVAIATGSTAAYSLNGINWTLSTLPASIAWSDIKYGNGVFVAGAGSTVAYSYDGIDWAVASNNVAASNLTYGNGFFFANGGGNTASYSSDGINWTNVTLPSDTHRGSTYGNGVFYNLGNGTNSYFSSDLLTWITGPGGSEGVTAQTPWYVNNTFVFKLSDGYSKTVTGPSGTLDLNPRFTGDINNVEIGNVKPAAAEFTTLAASGPVRFVSGLASTNFRNGSVVITGGVGIGGTLNVNNIGIGYTGIPYNPSIAFIGTTGDPIRLNVLSNNTLSFEGRSGQLFSINNNLSSGWIFSVNDISGIPLFRANADATISMAEYAGNVGIGLSNPTFKFQVNGSASIGGTLSVNNISGNLVYTPPAGNIGGTSWTFLTVPTVAGTSLSNVKYLNDRFVGFASTYIYYSNDAVTWTYSNPSGIAAGKYITDIGYGEGRYVYTISNGNFVGHGTNLTNWSTASVQNQDWAYVVYGNNRFVAINYGSTGAASTDGVSWTQYSLNLGFTNGLNFLNGFFYAYSDSAMFRSADGITWNQLTSPAYPRSLAYGNGLYIGGVYNSSTHVFSYDGVNFSTYTGSARIHAGAYYFNGVYYLTSNGGQIKYSTDGFNWSEVSTSVNGFLSYAQGRLWGGSGTSIWYSNPTSNIAFINPATSSNLDNIEIGRYKPNNANFVDVSINNNLNVSSTYNSTSPYNGALTVAGGVGIGGTTNLNTLRVNQDLVFTPSTGTTATAGGLLTANFPSFASAGSSMTRTVAFGNGRFVGAAGTSIIWSEDAVNWTRVNNPSTANAPYFIAYGNNTWVATLNAVGTELIYSTNNGNSWSTATIPYASPPTLVFGNGIFVLGSPQYTGISTNGINWSTYTPSYFPDRFINGFFYSNTHRSPDGYNWQALNIPTTNNAISYGNGLYFAAQYNSPNYYFSYDGVNFSTTTIGNAVYLNSAYYNGVYYLVTQHNNALLKYSTDGFNYTNVGYPNSSTNYGIAYGNNKIVLFNNLYTEATNYIYYAEASFGKANIQPFREGTIDNVTIGSRIPQAGTFNNVSVLKNLNVNSNFQSVSSNTGALTVLGGVGIGQTLNVAGSVNVSNSLNLVNSTTGIATTWTRTVVGTAATISYLAFANNLYVGVGYSSITSSDGINWTTRTLPNNLSYVTYGNGIWSGLLSGSALGATSTNGTSWTSYAMTNSRSWRNIVYGNGIFVTLAGSSNIAAYSLNGYNWTEVTMPTSQVWQVVVFGGGYFAAIANASATAVYSTDGINWNITTLPSASGWNCITYGNGYFYVTGSSTVGVYSKDLINWTTYTHNVTSTALAAYNNGTFVVVDVNGAFNSSIITGDFTSRTQIPLPGPQIPTTIVAGDRNFIAGYGQTFYTFPIPNNSITLSPNTTGEINNVEIGSVKPAAGNFSNIFSQGLVAIGATTRSTSPFNGSLTVSGGVGIGGTLNANSVVTYNRLQNQSFSGTAIGSTTYPSSNFGVGHNKTSYGNGVFVSTSSWNTANANYSTDGINWTSVSLPVNQPYPVNFFGNGYFVLAGLASTTILYSTDGQSWSQVSIGNTQSRSWGAYGNGKYVMVGSGATYYYSSNITSWTANTLPYDADWRLAYGNGMFVALAYGNGTLVYSYDAINWSISNTVGANHTDLYYGNGKFIVTTWSGWGVKYSIDGINWISVSNPGGSYDGNLLTVRYGNGVYAISDNGQTILSSTDGITWDPGVYKGGGSSYISYGNNRFAGGRWIDGPTNTVTLDPKFTGEINNVRIGAITPASGDFTNLSSTGSANLVGTVNANNLNILSKVNQTPVLGGFAGTTGWTSAALLSGTSNNALTFGNGLFISILRASSTINFSSDGKRWTASTMPFVGQWNDVAWGKDKFVAVVGVGTTGAFSGNGISWSSMNMPATAEGWYAVTYGDDKFVAVGNTSTTAYSSDGITWTGSSIANTNWTGVAYGNGTFVAVSGFGLSGAYSYDGINWNLINLPTNGGTGIKFITYGNGYFIVANYVNNDINYSRDGINWSTTVRTSTYGIKTDIAYGNGIYSIFNYQEATYSYDGVNWLLGNTIAATDWQAVAYGNNRFVATSVNTGQVGSIDGPSNTLNLHPKFTGDIDNVRIGAKQPAAAEFTNLAAQQPVRFTANTPSTNTTNGALMVLGGVGIGGSLNIGSDVIINGGRESNSTSTGSLIVRGGVGITGGLYVKPFSLSTKGLVVQANTSQSGNLFELQSAASSTITSFNSAGELNITSTTGSTSASFGSIVTAGGVGIGGSVSIGSTAGSASTTSGALKVVGGVGIGGALNVGGSVNFSSSIFGGVSTSIVPTMTFIGPANDPITLSVLSDNSLSFDGSSGQLFSINNNLSTGWIFSISDISGLPLFRTNADGTVSMGEFGGNVGIGLTNPTYKLQVVGNAGIANTLFVSGRANIGNTSFTDLYGSSYNPIITATDTFDDDIVIQIENKSDGVNARAGLLFKNNTNSVAQLYLSGENYGGAGLGFSEIRLYGDYPFVIDTKSTSIRASTSEVVNFDSTKMTVVANTESTSSSTGSLIVSGGAGIAKSVNIGGYLSSKPAYITAGLGADQTLTAGSDNLILFTDNADPNAWWTGVAGVGVSHIFKPNIAGLYFVSCQVHFKTGTGSGQMNIQARKNGSTFSISQEALNTVEGRTLNLSGVVQLNGSTDYVDFSAYTNSSGTPLLTGEANRQFSQAIIYKLF